MCTVGSSESSPTLPVRKRRSTFIVPDQPFKRRREDLTDNYEGNVKIDVSLDLISKSFKSCNLLILNLLYVQIPI